MTLSILVPGMLLVAAQIKAQTSDAEMPLGDLARHMRQAKIEKQPAKLVVDDDNFSRMMDAAEARRMAGASIGFFLGAPNPNAVPDFTCSLAFSAKSPTPFASPAPSSREPLKNPSKELLKEALAKSVATRGKDFSAKDASAKDLSSRDLPESELPKLEGPVALVGDSLQLSVYNGTAWNVQEITVSLSVARKRTGSAKVYTGGSVVPASAVQIVAKRADDAKLYHFKGLVAPESTTMLTERLGLNLEPGQEWHWAIVAAKGTPAP